MVNAFLSTVKMILSLPLSPSLPLSLDTGITHHQYWQWQTALSPSRTLNHPYQGILTDRRIFGDAKSCNLTISCRGRYFQAHKKVVCAQSAVLGKACFRVRISSQPAATGEWLMSLQEASGCLTLYIDDDPVVLEAMLQFLYTKNYGDKGRELGNGVYRDALMWHLLVRGIAKKV